MIPENGASTSGADESVGESAQAHRRRPRGEVGTLVAAILTARNWRVGDLAAHFGVAERTARRWLNGATIPNDVVMAALKKLVKEVAPKRAPKRATKTVEMPGKGPVKTVHKRVRERKNKSKNVRDQEATVRTMGADRANEQRIQFQRDWIDLNGHQVDLDRDWAKFAYKVRACWDGFQSGESKRIKTKRFIGDRECRAWLVAKENLGCPASTAARLVRQAHAWRESLAWKWSWGAFDGWRAISNLYGYSEKQRRTLLHDLFEARACKPTRSVGRITQETIRDLATRHEFENTSNCSGGSVASSEEGTTGNLRSNFNVLRGYLETMRDKEGWQLPVHVERAMRWGPKHCMPPGAAQAAADVG